MLAFQLGTKLAIGLAGVLTTLLEIQLAKELA